MSAMLINSFTNDEEMIEGEDDLLSPDVDVDEDEDEDKDVDDSDDDEDDEIV